MLTPLMLGRRGAFRCGVVASLGVLGAVELVVAPTRAAAQDRDLRAPALVSPGAPERFPLVSSSCPTFSWDPVAGATSHELSVFLVTPDASSTDSGATEIDVSEVLNRWLPGAASSWTPDLDDCLSSGRYAWAVRALGDGGEGAWSEPRRFEIPAVADRDELGRALEIVRRHHPELFVTGEREERAGRSDERDAPAVSGNKLRVARSGTAAPTLLNVSGNVNATSYTGDGSKLTKVTAVAGESATGFFTTGQIEAARISDAIARDSEIPSLEVGDISAVLAGTGLVGGAASGDATLSADTTYLQRRVSASCDAGSSIRQIADDGSVTCESDSGQGSFNKRIAAIACTAQGTFGSGTAFCSGGDTLRANGTDLYPCVALAGTGVRTHVCDLDLPAGAEIVRITGYGLDTTSNGYFEAAVWRTPNASLSPAYISPSFGGTWQSSGLASTPGSTSLQVYTDADPPHSVLAGSRYTLGFGTYSESGTVFFYGFDVAYTIP